MPRQLRLAFAMGGGVSLGTFSGAALSEAVKLAILRARWTDEDGQAREYDDVVIDVFSGASAGAMALAVMLRTLVERTEEQEQHAADRLLNDFGDEFAEQFQALQDDARRDMIAAQVVQDVQERIWVHDISLDRLLGGGGGDGGGNGAGNGAGDGGRGGDARDLRWEPGLLDRRAVEEIARRELLPSGDTMPLGGRRLLGPRVLFACALSNLTPMLYDGRTQGEAHRAGFLGLGDGLTSWGHRELRVFDLSFRSRKVDASSRWCRYHGAAEKPGKIGDLRERRTWSKIAATSIAAGAFPFAFAPVVLKRKKYEYGERLWPKRLEGLDEYPFSYVDGGAFNNEPIREAFRLAGFIDALDPGDDFDRRVIFVDPRVGGLTVPMRVPVHTEFLLEEPNVFGTFDGIDLRRRGTLDRLKDQARTLATAVLNESTTIEEDKVYRTMSRFELRDELRGRLGDVLRDDADGDAFARLRSFCEEQLEPRADALIPRGGLSLDGELERVAAEVADFAHLRDGAEAFLELDDPAGSPDAADWLRALTYLAVDLAMGLGGKRQEHGLIAIAPFVGLDRDDPVPKLLPGGAVSGFAGFVSPLPGEYEVALARHCAREFLEACELVARAEAPPEPPEWTEDDERAFRREIERGLRRLADRARAVVTQSHLLRLPPGLQDIVLEKVADRVHAGVLSLIGAKPETTVRCEFRIVVPDNRYEFDGAGIGDRDIRPVVMPDGSLRLITFADYRPDADGGPGGWTGAHVKEGRTGPEIRVHRDRRGPLPDRAFCTIALPDAEEAGEADRWPNPIFEGELKPDEHEERQEIPDFWRLVGLTVPSLEDALSDEA